MAVQIVYTLAGVRRGNVQVYLPGAEYPLRSLTDIQNAIAEGKRTGNVVRVCHRCLIILLFIWSMEFQWTHALYR